MTAELVSSTRWELNALVVCDVFLKKVVRTVPVLMTRVLEKLALLDARERAAVEDIARPDLLNCSGTIIGKACALF